MQAGLQRLQRRREPGEQQTHVDQPLIVVAEVMLVGRVLRQHGVQRDHPRLQSQERQPQDIA